MRIGFTISPKGSELFKTLFTRVIKLVLKNGKGLRIVTIAPRSETAVSTNRSLRVYLSACPLSVSVENIPCPPLSRYSRSPRNQAIHQGNVV